MVLRAGEFGESSKGNGGAVKSDFPLQMKSLVAEWQTLKGLGG